MDMEGRNGGFMLLQFKFKNHKCFYDETILDLTATQEKRHSETLIDVNGNKILPVISIHGANASGKTTIIDALWFMFSTVKNSFMVDVHKELVTVPFLFSEKSRKENSEYEISLNIDDYEYRYGFSLNEKEIEEEWLYRKKFSFNTTSTSKLVFERQKKNVQFGKSYSKYKNIWDLYNKEIDSSKLLILSHIARKDENGFLRNIYEYMYNFNVKIDNSSNSISIDILNKDDLVYKKFQKLLNEFDPCLLGIKIDPIEDENGKKTFKINGIHRQIDNPNKEIAIPLTNESFGTIKIFNILPSILVSLENGSLLCIDELDVKLHPLLFKKIVSMYNDKKINQKNAQLVFTSHSTFMFNSNDMRRDQLYLVEKNVLGQSRLYSLSEFRNLRVDADYEKKYLTGQFGAIPFDND